MATVPEYPTQNIIGEKREEGLKHVTERWRPWRGWRRHLSRAVSERERERERERDQVFLMGTH